MAKKVIYTKQLGRRVAKGYRSAFMKPRFHVISGVTNRWSVLKEGNIRSVKTFSNQIKAISFAKNFAQRTNGEVVIHNRIGQIRDTISYMQ